MDITDDEFSQARRAAEAALVFVRDRTVRPQVGLVAATMLTAVLCRTLRVDRDDAAKLLRNLMQSLEASVAENNAVQAD